MKETIHPLLVHSPTNAPENTHADPSEHQLPTAIDRTNCLAHPSTSPASSSLPTSVATDALLFQNLRAQAQQLGLDSESLGWTIIQSIHSAQSAGRGLGTYASLIDSLGGRTPGLLLLLPKAKLHPDHRLTPEIVLHHILLTNPSRQESNQFAEHYLCNLNGWKGLMESDRLVFTSPGRPIPLHQINDIDSR